MDADLWPVDQVKELENTLNALEQAIGEICDMDTAHAIHERMRMIRERKK